MSDGLGCCKNMQLGSDHIWNMQSLAALLLIHYFDDLYLFFFPSLPPATSRQLQNQPPKLKNSQPDVPASNLTFLLIGNDYFSTNSGTLF